MPKQYENQSPYPNPELIKRVGVLGDLWKPGMSDVIVNKLYEAVMNPDTPPIVIDYLCAGIDLDQGNPSDSGWKPQDRNVI